MAVGVFFMFFLPVRAMGRELTSLAPTELTIGNLVRRVLFLIREEHATCVR
jgi:translation initiation factor 2B subunit (eIF-2B alpha/beta/delta family)